MMRIIYISGNRIVVENMVYMAFSEKPVKNEEYIEFNLEADSPLYMARYNEPSPSGSFHIDRERYEAELSKMITYWENAL